MFLFVFDEGVTKWFYIFSIRSFFLIVFFLIQQIKCTTCTKEVRLEDKCVKQSVMLVNSTSDQQRSVMEKETGDSKAPSLSFTHSNMHIYSLCL